MLGRLFKYVLPLKLRLISLLIVAGLLAIITLGEPATMGIFSDAIFYRTNGFSFQDYLPRHGGDYDLETAWVTRTDGKAFEMHDQELINRAFDQDDGVEPVSTQLIHGGTRVQYRKPRTAKTDIILTNAEQNIKASNIPVEIARIVQRAEPAGDRFLPNIPTVFIIPFVLVLLQVFRSIFRYGQALLSSSIGQKIIMRMRNEVFQHMQQLSVGYFEHKQTGHLMSRVTNDIQILQNLFSYVMVEIIVEPLIVIAGIIYGFTLNWRLTLVFIAAMPILVIPIRRIGGILRKVGNEIQAKAAETSAILQESLTSIRVVKAFTMEDYEVDRFRKQTKANYKATMKGAQLQGALTQIVELLAVIGLAAFVWYGGHAVFNRVMEPKDLMTFILVMGYISNPIRKLSNLSGQFQHAMAAAERTFNILDEVPEVKEIENPIVLPKLQGGVSFDNVSFRYQEGPEVLQSINLDVRPGEVIALVGPSGSGKTTMVNLLPRFYDPASGQVFIDGYNLKSVELRSLRNQMGIVPQETILFHGTIAENIAYGKIGATRDEIVEAAIAANADDFIKTLPEGYATMVGERGATLSGGQRQRVAIARAILRDPRILILDEATSALDTASEHLVQEALERLMLNRTTFVIAHRLSTIRRANRIIVMDKGRIIESGTHDELLRENGIYRSLYEKQFQLKEANDGTQEKV